jgi:hypothetical protein
MNETAKSGFWDAIDAILIVNLAHRTDRWERLSGTLSQIGVADKIHRIDAIDGKTLPGYLAPPWFRARTPEPVARMKAGSAGCCLSHRKAIAYAREKGFERVLVMEDDAHFLDDLTGPEGDAVAELLREDGQWHMLYLGFYQKLNKHHVARRLTLNSKPFELWRIRGPLMFHATVLHHSVYDRLLHGLPTVANIWSWMTYWGSMDAWIYNRFGRDRNVMIWATMPKLVVQVANYSDICGRVLTTGESEGSHIESKLVPLDYPAFEATLDLTAGEKVLQVLKRSGRVARAWLFGYRKT